VGRGRPSATAAGPLVVDTHRHARRRPSIVLHRGETVPASVRSNSAPRVHVLGGSPARLDRSPRPSTFPCCFSGSAPVPIPGAPDGSCPANSARRL
jgi:hypothetical protein